MRQRSWGGAVCILWIGLFCAVGAPAASVANSCRGGCDSKLGVLQRIERFVFPSSITTSGYTKGVVYAARGYSFRSLEEINQYNIRSAHVVAGTAQRFELDDRPLESKYWWSIHTETGARRFIQGLAAALGPESPNADRRSLTHDLTVVEKALAQRDLVQTYGLLASAVATALDEETQLSAARIERLLVRLVQSLLLTENEYLRLRSQLPRKVPRHFSTIPREGLADHYLPLRVLASDDSWLEIRGGPKPFRHYTSYGGRSFIKVYMRAPKRTPKQVADLWRWLFRTYGQDLHVTSVNEPTPAGLETLLVRTFGVFLEGGSYRDSTWPEEITIRRLMFPTERVDLTSSDFRGTQFFQYKLSRSLAIEDPATLGLRRVLDDDKQFFGFFGDVPDRANSYSDTVTTMRSNCIACHSELFYGLNTVFSFERDPDQSSSEQGLTAPGPTTGPLEALQRRLRDE
jgi:hypothetical protein